eukprot:GHVU01016988.1.p1 GENE.GHVU01016988.1~~GHVU01016988.1.p1  ORF type:complete len:157 (+),score=19.51 GHVU01016988.1:3-473(+)
MRHDNNLRRGRTSGCRPLTHSLTHTGVASLTIIRAIALIDLLLPRRPTADRPTYLPTYYYLDEQVLLLLLLLNTEIYTHYGRQANSSGARRGVVGLASPHRRAHSTNDSRCCTTFTENKRIEQSRNNSSDLSRGHSTTAHQQRLQQQSPTPHSLTH